MDCGTDIIEIYRIKEAIEKNGDTFLNKVYTKGEIEYCESKKNNKYQHYAGRFAAKEAASKMLGTGFAGDFDWKDIEVLNNESGKPELNLYRGAKDLFEKEGYEKVSVSISHSKEYATSIVIGYWQSKEK